MEPRFRSANQGLPLPSCQAACSHLSANLGRFVLCRVCCPKNTVNQFVCFIHTFINIFFLCGNEAMQSPHSGRLGSVLCPGSFCACSAYSGFLPQSKNMHIMVIGDCVQEPADHTGLMRSKQKMDGSTGLHADGGVGQPTLPTCHYTQRRAGLSTDYFFA